MDAHIFVEYVLAFTSIGGIGRQIKKFSTE